VFFRSLILRTANIGFIKRLVTRSRLFRPLVRRFIAGELLNDAMAAAEELAARGFGSSLDLLGENVANLDEARKAKEGYIEVIERIAKSAHKDKINISIKLTALGLDQGEAEAEANFRELLAAAKPHGIFIRADMEGSPYTERTITMIERVFPDFPNTGTVLQSMLHRTRKDVQRLVDLGCRVRIVKGAYLEGEEVAYQDKSKVDEEYVWCAKELLRKANYPAVATHDENIVGQLKEFVAQEPIPAERFEWQMLFGIRRDLQEKLLAEGFNVRVYIPYGAEWYPYFTRRLAERPANVMFIAKSLVRK
jgi:proline dehydrogenase